MAPRPTDRIERHVCLLTCGSWSLLPQIAVGTSTHSETVGAAWFLIKSAGLAALQLVPVIHPMRRHRGCTAAGSFAMSNGSAIRHLVGAQQDGGRQVDSSVFAVFMLMTNRLWWIAGPADRLAFLFEFCRCRRQCDLRHLNWRRNSQSRRHRRIRAEHKSPAANGAASATSVASAHRKTHRRGPPTRRPVVQRTSRKRVKLPAVLAFTTTAFRLDTRCGR